MTGSFRPFGDKHAINTVAFVVEFDAPLNSNALRELSILHSRLKGYLPRKAEEQAVVVNLSPHSQGNTIRTGSPELGGVTFDRLAPDGRQEWALKIQPNLAQVLCTNYDRWESVWSRAKSFFDIVFPVIHKHSAISVVGLQYIDEFMWEGTKSELDPSELFQKNSKYLVPNAYEMNDLWHCHHGYFAENSSPAPCKLLNNVNIDLSDSAENRVVRITTTHRANLQDRILAHISLANAENNGNTVDNHMKALHVENKQLLSKLLTEKIRKRIHLD